MKRTAIVVMTAVSMLASTAMAATTPELTRQIDSRTASAQQKADAATVEFDSGDRASGCKALKGAARDLDSGLDMALQVADRVHNDHGIDEETRSVQEAAVRNSLQNIVNRRTNLERDLADNCQDI